MTIYSPSSFGFVDSGMAAATAELEAESQESGCAHEWSFSGTDYGGDDDSYHGEGRCYCRFCGADGDA